MLNVESWPRYRVQVNVPTCIRNMMRFKLAGPSMNTKTIFRKITGTSALFVLLLSAGQALAEMRLASPPGKEIRLLPARPKDWDVAFKLHAPYNTTVEEIFESGELKNLKVTPKLRERDIVYTPTR